MAHRETAHSGRLAFHPRSKATVGPLLAVLAGGSSVFQPSRVRLRVCRRIRAAFWQGCPLKPKRIFSQKADESAPKEGRLSTPHCCVAMIRDSFACPF